MGNTNGQYNKVSTGEGFGSPYNLPTKDTVTEDKEVDRNDLMFVFHNTEEDSSERVVHEQMPRQRDEDEETNFTVSCNHRIISERRVFTEPCPIETLLNILQPGDLVEFTEKYKCHHWVVYVGSGSCVHLKHGVVKEETCKVVCGSRMTRIVNDVYTFMALPSHQICSTARTQIDRESTWSSSESFAAWCRFGRPELTTEGCKVRIKDLDSNTPEHILKKEYCLEVYDSSTITKTHKFLNLSDLISFRRKLEREL